VSPSPALLPASPSFPLTLSPSRSVSSVRLPTYAESGRPKGFGYVEFSSLDGAEAAIAKGGPTASGEGLSIEGRTVRLDYSQPRGDRQQGGGGRGGGRGGFGGDRGGRESFRPELSGLRRA
jgi:nucleolin